jgi:restriction system protein
LTRNKGARKSSDPKRAVLEKAIAFLALGAGLFIASAILAGSPMLAPITRLSRMAAPWMLFLGGLLLVLYIALRRSSLPRIETRNDPIGFGESTSTFREPTISPAPQIEHPPREEPRSEWSGAVFDQIEWRRFEAVCQALFAQAGFEAKSQSHGPDGGVDIWLHSRHADGPASIVQCKHWRKPVGVKEVREFFGVMASHGLKRGTFATSSTFTKDATTFAKSNGISALDRDGLLDLIARRDHAQQRELLQAAYEGEYWRPTCASCGIKMVERTSRDKGEKFWGCAQFPKCRATLQMH